MKYRHKLNRVHQSRAGRPEPQGRMRRELDRVPKPYVAASSVTISALEAKLTAIDKQAKLS